jgi:hypothetical protein
VSATHVTQDIPVTARQFHCPKDTFAVIAMAGTSQVNVCDNGILQVRVTSGAWITVQPGFWIIREADGSLNVSSDDFFVRFFRATEK